MSTNAFIIGDSGTITAVINGIPRAFAKDHPRYGDVKDALNEGNFTEVDRIANLPKAVSEYVKADNSVAEFKDGQIFYNGKPLHNSLTVRIINFMSEKLPFKHLLKFLENLMQNSSKHAIDELYNFLAHRNLPITEDGCFLAYKRVDSEYKDLHTHSIDNSIGSSPFMLRNEVDDDWRLECSSGFHVGAIEYVATFDNHVPGTHVMIVKVNPKDVVSVPTADSFQKCRTCAYTVVGEMQAELTSQLYSTTKDSFQPITSSQDEDYDEDEDEDENEYDWQEDEDIDEDYEDEDDEDEDEDDDY